MWRRGGLGHDDAHAAAATTAVVAANVRVLERFGERSAAALQGLTLVHFSTERKHISWDILGGFSDNNGSR